jgi:uncharacterized RDD family membrane protein YckC
MKTINIPTFLNIDLSFEMSSVGRRFGAYFIDWGVKWIYLFIATFSFNITLLGNQTLTSFIIFSPFFFYSFLLEWLNKGQTLGKMFLNIKVVGIDGNPPTVSQCAIRWMFLLVDSYLFALFTFINPLFAGLMLFSPFVGCIMISTTKQQQRIGDIAAQTFIVNFSQTEVSIYDTIYAYSVSKKKEHEVHFPEIIKLSDRDMTIVKNLLERSETDYEYELAHKVALHIKKILLIESKEDDYVFLKKLLADYNYLSLKQ